MSDAPAEGLLPPPIELVGVGVRFGDSIALEDVSLRVERGEIAVIIGGSGAGKTTLGRVIAGLQRPSTGAVRVEGTDIARLSERALRAARARFGMVFQYSALLDSMTVLENVGLPLAEHERLDRREIEARARAMLAALDLTGCDALLPGELSGGMRKRVALARALIREPSVVVYDEPASGLDPLGARRVDDLIRRTRDRFGVTSVVISHDMTQAFTLATNLHVLDKGRLVASGPPQVLMAEVGSIAARFYEASRAVLEQRSSPTPQSSTMEGGRPWS
jgi:phospholipid/cholesterol/gamma-HCH transport system ATP-binding protein